MTLGELSTLVRSWSAAGAMLAALVMSLACGSPAPPAGDAAPAPAPAAAPAAPAPVVMLIEPGEGSSSGHIDLFRWSPVEGADGYRMVLTAATDGRTVFDSQQVSTTEVRLPNTIALEPEGYFWQVTALKGSDVLAVSPQSRFSVTP